MKRVIIINGIYRTHLHFGLSYPQRKAMQNLIRNIESAGLRYEIR